MCGNSGASMKGSDGLDYQPVSGVHATVSQG